MNCIKCNKSPHLNLITCQIEDTSNQLKTTNHYFCSICFNKLSTEYLNYIDYIQKITEQKINTFQFKLK
jgi:hypothetical protein